MKQSRILKKNDIFTFAINYLKGVFQDYTRTEEYTIKNLDIIQEILPETKVDFN
jgi:hypothetical protein